MASLFEHRRRSKIRFRSAFEANWSEFELSELQDLRYKVIESFNSLVGWDSAARPYQEVFMFSDDANASFVSMNKPENMKFFPFMLDKISYSVLTEVTQKVSQYAVLTSPYKNGQSIRDFAIDHFDLKADCQSFLRSEALRLEREIIGKIEEFFVTEIDVIRRILFSNW